MGRPVLTKATGLACEPAAPPLVPRTPGSGAHLNSSSYNQRLRRKNASIPTSAAAMKPKIVQKASAVPKPGKCTFIPKKPVISVSGSRITENTVRIAQDVVLAVVDDRLVRVLERLDHLLVVVEHVPDALGGVDDVVEVLLELLGQEPLDMALEQAQRRALRLDDLPVADDLLLDVREVAYDLVRAALEDVVLERVELVADLVEDREAVVEEVVEDLVEQPARSPSRRAARGRRRPPRSG